MKKILEKYKEKYGIELKREKLQEVIDTIRDVVLESGSVSLPGIGTIRLEEIKRNKIKLNNKTYGSKKSHKFTLKPTYMGYKWCEYKIVGTSPFPKEAKWYSFKGKYQLALTDEFNYRRAILYRVTKGLGDNVPTYKEVGWTDCEWDDSPINMFDYFMWLKKKGKL